MSIIITTQMIRDRLAFKGPLTLKGLEVELGVKYAEFAQPLSKGVKNGVIKEHVMPDNIDNGGPVYLFSTDWVDDVKK